MQLFECRLPKERASVRHVAQQAAATHRLGQRCMSAYPEHGEEKPILLLPVRDRLVNLHIKDEELLVLGIINRWSLVCLLFKFCATLSICKGTVAKYCKKYRRGLRVCFTKELCLMISFSC